MNLKQLKEKLEKKNASLRDLERRHDAAEDIAEIRSIQAQIREAEDDIRDLKDLISDAEAREAAPPAPAADPAPNPGEERTAAVNNSIPEIVHANADSERGGDGNGAIEQRVERAAQELRDGGEITIDGAMLRHLEQRAATSSGLMLENKYSRDISGTFNEVSALINNVHLVPLDGGNSYQVAFEIGANGGAEYTEEGDFYYEDDVLFGKASTGRAKITRMVRVDEEVVELPNIDYLSRIVQSVQNSIRKKISQEILIGAGGDNEIKGLYNQPETLVPASYNIAVGAIDADTLRKIVFAYGGDEDIAGPQALVLNKKDLEAFAAVKNQIGDPVYKIDKDKSTIEEVKGGVSTAYIINSRAKAITNSATASGTKTMLYGEIFAYEMPQFAPLTVQRLNEKYADKGQIGFIGRIIIGGVLNKYKAILPVIKGTAPAPGASAKYPEGDPSESWTLPQLRAYAADKDIDLTRKNTKEQILDAITAAAEAAAEDEE